MQVWLRLLIVWIVAIALPVQGIAGASMTHCGSSHDHMAAALQAAHHRPADHGLAAAHPHDTVAVHHAVQADQDTATPAPSKASDLSDRAAYKCSSCASCCAGSALPNAAPRLPQALVEPAAFAEVMVAIDAFASDRPDRPPRPPLV